MDLASSYSSARVLVRACVVDYSGSPGQPRRGAALVEAMPPIAGHLDQDFAFRGYGRRPHTAPT